MRAKISELTPKQNLVSTQISRDVYNRSYQAFIIVLILFSVLMGYITSQLYETQKDLKDLKTQYEIISITLNKRGNI